jgi:hypothetical protein
LLESFLIPLLHRQMRGQHSYLSNKGNNIELTIVSPADPHVVITLEVRLKAGEKYREVGRMARRGNAAAGAATAKLQRGRGSEGEEGVTMAVAAVRQLQRQRRGNAARAAARPQRRL